MIMSRTTVIPLVFYLVLIALLFGAQARYGWSDEAIGWPGLIIIGAAVLLRLRMKDREAAAKAASELAEGARSTTDGAAGAAQAGPSRKASSST